MKDTKAQPGFNTGICESTHSKLTLISAIGDLKKLLNQKVYIFRSKTIEHANFLDAVNQDGCIHLKGINIEGRSLYDYYLEYKPARFYSEETRKIIFFTHEILETSEKIREVTGSYPHLLMNGVFITSDGEIITYLPALIVDYINKHLTLEAQYLIYYPITLKKAQARRGKPPSVETIKVTDKVEPFDFARAIARLLYMFLLKIGLKHEVETLSDPGALSRIMAQPVFYLGDHVREIRPELSDAIWELMHDRGIERGLTDKAISDLKQIIKECLSMEKTSGPIKKIPLLKRSSFILFKSRVSAFFLKKWKYVIVGVLAVLLLLYLFSDIFRGREKIDYLRGLSPRQVVELYYNAINNLDLDALDAVFYKRAGKEIRNELATIVVITRMEQAFGKRMIHPNQLEGSESLPVDSVVFGIDDLNIQQVSDDENPVFFTTYYRVISSEGNLQRSRVEETIFLKKINDYWYITDTKRNIKEEQ
jgi:hypothetical protein